MQECSRFYAGSGSNQSNHLYKLGPIHQGIMERGAKTTSDSYVLWPSRIGAFNIIMGRHYKHCDTTDFPFFYLIESKDESILVPSVNLKSIGTVRDTQKWPRRDIRTDSNLLDLINFNLLSPYTIHKMINGRKKLLAIRKSSGSYADLYSYDMMKINKKSLDRGIHLYEMAIWKFFGNSIITRLQNGDYTNNKEIGETLKPDTSVGKGFWVDLSGMLCPYEALDKLLTSIEKGKVASLEEVNSGLTMIHNNYYNYEWSLVADELEEFFDKKMEELTADDVIFIIEKWKESVLGIDKYLYEDAKKEFSMVKKTGFGVDGLKGAREKDFAEVRGDFEDNETVKAIKEHMKRKEKLGNQMIKKMLATKEMMEKVHQ